MGARGNFVSYQNAQELMDAIGKKFDTLEGAYVFRGTISFANLPSTLTQSMVGYIYNINESFTTDSRFIEGAGKVYSAGTNVAVADIGQPTYSEVTPVGTENPSEEGWFEEDPLNPGSYILSEDTEVDSEKTYYEEVETHDYKFDVNSSWVDVEGLEQDIQNVSDMITGEFNATESYDAGEVVVYEGDLYKFNTAHAAGAWDGTDADQTTVVELINQAEPDSLTPAQVTALLALL